MRTGEDITEAEYLERQSDQGATEACPVTSNELVDDRRAALERLKRLMRDARAAKVGEIIRCAQCDKRIEKRSYQTAFCSNAKTHGKHNCKDRYHNRLRGLEAYFAERSD